MYRDAAVEERAVDAERAATARVHRAVQLAARQGVDRAGCGVLDLVRIGIEDVRAAEREHIVVEEAVVGGKVRRQLGTEFLPGGDVAVGIKGRRVVVGINPRAEVVLAEA